MEAAVLDQTSEKTPEQLRAEKEWEAHEGKRIEDLPHEKRFSVMEFIKRGMGPPRGGSLADKDELDRQIRAEMEIGQWRRKMQKIEEDIQQGLSTIGGINGGREGHQWNERQNEPPPGEAIKGKRDEWRFVAEDKNGERVEKNENGGLIKQETDVVKMSKIKVDWSEYGTGWTNEKIKQVGKNLVTHLNLDFGQAKSVLEIMLAKGKKPEDFSNLETLAQESKTQIDQWLNDPEKRGQAENYKNNPAAFCLLQKLNLPFDWIRKFVFYKDFTAENDHEADRNPDSIEGLAWRAMNGYGHGEWGLSGRFPLLEMRIIYKHIDDDPRKGYVLENGKKVIDTEKSKYYVNESNFVTWAQNRMWFAWDFNQESPVDFFSAVKIDRPSGFGTVSLQDVFLNPKKFFNSEDGKTEYYELYRQLVKQSMALTLTHSWSTQLHKIRDEPDKLKQGMLEAFLDSKLTKQTFEKNLLNLMTTFSHKFKGYKKGEEFQSDNNLGAAWLEMHHILHHLSDFDKLREMLGSKSDFFDKKKMLEIFKNVQSMQTGVSGEKRQSAPFTAEKLKYFEKAFDAKTGRVETREQAENFIKFINIYGDKGPDPNVETFLKYALMEVVGDKYELNDDDGKRDEHARWYAYMLANSIPGFSGGAGRNDVEAGGFNRYNRLMHFQQYRNKMLPRGDFFGNFFSMFQMKSLLVDMWSGIRTTDFEEVDREYRNEKGEWVKDSVKRYRTPLEIFDELIKLKTTQKKLLEKLNADLNGAGLSKEEKEKRMAEAKSQMDQAYLDRAGKLQFEQGAQEYYVRDHFQKALHMYDTIMEQKEQFKFEDFTTHHPLKGVTFDAEKFTNAYQKNFVKPLRYLFRDYGKLDFSRKVRSLDQQATIVLGKPVWRDMPLGEAMFGYDMLNRKEFWKDSKDGGYERDEDGRIRIDYHKVQDSKNQRLLVKQFIMSKFAADFLAHKAYHAKDPRYDFTYYLNVIDALKSLPVDIEGDEFTKLGKIKAEEGYFNKADMEWFHKRAKTATERMFGVQMLKDLTVGQRGHPDGKIGFVAFLAALGFFIRAIAQQTKSN